MPTVASKLSSSLDNPQTRKLFNVPSEYYAGAIFASTVLYYWGPPLLNKLISSTSNKNYNQNNDNNNYNKAKTKAKACATDDVDVENQENLDELKIQNETTKGKVLKLAKKIPALNLDFILQFLRLIKIMIPGVFCRETVLLTGHTVSLIIRTFLSIYVANMEGAIVKYIVRKDANNFVRMLIKWFTVALPATFINSMIRYLESKLALAFRTRLVEHSYKLYFKNQTYYRTSVLDGRLDNCAQRLTDDIEMVASVVARLYSQITKPLFDLLLIGVALARLTVSSKASLLHGPMLCVSVVGLTGYILKVVSPRFGQLVAQEAEKKGHLRHVHARLIANAEEIAFYNGHKVELSQLRSAYRTLCVHMQKIFGIKLWFVMLEQFLMKYCWSGAGMIVVSLPILMSQSKASSEGGDGGISDRTQYFTTAKNLLHSASDAVERLMSSYKEIVELAGHTSRVENMFTVFEETSNGIYKKTIVAQGQGNSQLEFKNGQPVAKGRIVTTNDSKYEIILKDVPIVTPNCDVVCPQLSMELRPGMHVLITGPNGCGKSSLFRIISGLWPIYAGELHRPEGKTIFYIPQRPYLTIGNLKDQIIYPDSASDMINKQISDKDLDAIMHLVRLEHIVRRDSYTQVKDWTDILSGGEKQRLAMARLFYHRPKYALLDECTSAVSIDVESSMYQAAIDKGITLLTITHRPTLWRFHSHILQFDGEGHSQFKPLDAEKLLAYKKEKEDLLQKPKTLERDNRLKELSKLLGEDIPN